MSGATDLTQLSALIEDWRALPLCVTDQIELPVDASAAWPLVGNPQRLPELISMISSAKMVPDGFRVRARGTQAVGRFDAYVPEHGVAGRYMTASMWGVPIPTPELDGFWISVTPSGEGVRIEFGRVMQFKNPLAQRVGRRLLPVYREQMAEMCVNAARLLAPEFAASLA